MSDFLGAAQIAKSQITQSLNGSLTHMLEEFEQEYLPLRDKVRELREYL
ncbi:MAG: hypothetical protein ACR2IF_14265 [Terriglobales bacterium]